MTLKPNRIPGPSIRHPIQKRFVLTPQHVRFVEEFLLSHDPDDAARRVGLLPKDGRRLLAHRRIQDAISFASRRALSRQQIYLEDVLRNLVALRDADPNELVELRRVNCRNCHGQDHEYQYTDVEFRRARTEHLARQLRLPDEERVPFDERGGPNFNLNGAPDPECPECGGDGILRVIVKDTRTLSYGARLLYDGVKVGAGGAVEVKFRDRAWAEDRLLRYAGAFNDRRAPTDPNRLNDSQLIEAVATLVERGDLAYEALPPPDDPDVTDVEPIEADDVP